MTAHDQHEHDAQHTHDGHDADAGGHDHHGHGDHGHGDHVAMFRRLFFANLVLAIPVVALDPMFAHLLGYSLPTAGWLTWVAPVLGTVMYLWGGRPFLTGAVAEAKNRAPGMMLLVALGITVAFLASWGARLGVLAPELSFWWELALLVVIMLAGHWIEMRSLAQTSSALDSLAALLPDEAERIVAAEGEDPAEARRTEPVAPADLALGDVVLVRPGAAVPADGRIVAGAADLDESMITGESTPVHREVGDDVTAGTVATDSALRVEVTAVGEDTALAGIQGLVTRAQESSTRTQRLADRAAGWLFWYAIGAGVLTAIAWAILGTPEQAVARVVTVLVIACPHALGLAIPLVVSTSTERAARGGVLVTDRMALEAMRGVDTVLYDKTGTLTRGEPTVLDVAPAGGEDGAGDRLLALAVAAESPSEHPLARAIVRAAEERGLDVPAARDFAAEPATGVRAAVDGHDVRVGGPALLEAAGAAELPVADQWRAHGAIILHVLLDGEVAGALRLADEVRPEATQAVEALRAQHIDVVMITGDARAVAESVAAEVGISGEHAVHAGVRPEDKAGVVTRLQGEGRTVAMVGDGVNDAPALAAADVGLAIGAGTDVAIGSAGVVLASSDPRSVLSVLELSRAAYRKMRQNLGWAAGYNLLAVPLAAGVLAPIGFVLPMSIGAILMSLSTVVVALNAQTLRRLDLRPEASARAALDATPGRPGR